MKNRLTIFCALALSCLLSNASVIEVVGSIKPLAPELRVLGRPVLASDNSFIVASAGSDIVRVDMADSSIEKIADGRNTYGMALSPDNKTLSFLRAAYGDDRLRYNSLESVDLSDKSLKTIVKKSRTLSTADAVAPDTSRPVVGVSYGHLTVDGNVIDPQGKGSYLWPALSPDGKRIVYWCVGHGCFVCDIDGSNPRPLGELHAPVWSGDDVVIGMRDRDNGMFVTESSLVACDIETLEQQALTPTDIVAMYPAATESRVVFTDAEGRLFYIDIIK